MGLIKTAEQRVERGFLPVINKKNTEETLIPLRATKTSAGYDFYTPVRLVIEPQQKVFFWTDVKAPMKKLEALLLDVRSGAGVKLDLMLANTLGLVDQDYCDNADNEGNIGICLRNMKPAMELVGYSEIEARVLNSSVQEAQRVHVPIIKDLREENTVVIEAGERVAQGFFINFLESDNCNTQTERGGGFGSSGK